MESFFAFIAGLSLGIGITLFFTRKFVFQIIKWTPEETEHFEKILKTYEEIRKHLET